MFHIQEKKTISQNLLLTAAFGLLGAGFSHISFQIPGIPGAVSDARELFSLSGIIFLSHPVYALLLGILVSLGGPYDALPVTLAMHIVTIPLAWMLLHALKCKLSHHFRLTLAWFFGVILLYLLSFGPVYTLFSWVQGRLAWQVVVQSYLTFTSAVIFEALFTAVFTTFFLNIILSREVILKEQKMLKNVYSAADNIAFIQARPVAGGLEITQWSPGAEVILRVPQAQALSRQLTGLLDPQLCSVLKQHIEQLRQGSSSLRFESHFRDGEDRERLGWFSLYPVYEDATLEQIILVVIDITYKLESERQMIYAQKMETVAAMSTGLAHDFNNLLTGIMGSANMIELELNKQDPVPAHNLKNFLETINLSANRASAIVQQLLNFSRRLDIKKQPCDLVPIIRHAVTVTEHSSDPSVRLEQDLPAGPAVIDADPALLEQVLLNLLVNAVHAMTLMRPPGQDWGGTLSVSLHEGRLSSMGEWEIVIRDEGVGIPDEITEKIMLPFFTTKSAGKGTGLGLSMVYNIVNQMRGNIRFESRAGKGTVFIISFPRHIAAA